MIDSNPIEGVLLWPLSAKEACAVDPEIRKTGNDYWLRSLGRPGYYYYYWESEWDDEFEEEYMPPAMAIVKADGSVAIQSGNASYWNGMRPAFKLRKSDIVMTSYDKRSSEDGKLTQVSLNSTTKLWKVTLRDAEHENFKIDSCDVEFGEQGSLTVKYTGAKTGDNEFISAIIKGADGSVKQYGRVAKVTASSGTATITGLPTDSSGKVSLPEGDKLYVFNEQYHSEMYGQKTDYSSDLQEVSLTGHKWVFDEFHYNQSTGNTIARYHCSVDSAHKETATASSGFEYVDPTCNKKGEMDIVYTISEDTSLDGKAHREVTKIADWKEPLGHEYTSFCGFRWTGDASSGYTKAEAIFRCQRDSSHVTYVNAVVTSKVQEPTCTAIGRTLYQATIDADKSLDGKDHGEAKYAKAKPRLGHDWGEATYIWADDNSSVTATHVCKRDSSHVGTETVKTEITNITKAPTCKETGVGDFKTKDFWDSAFQEQTKTGATIPVDPDAHKWPEEGEKQVNPNSCGGYVTVFTCELCGEEKEEITGGSDHAWTENKVEYSKPTCTEMGELMYQCTKCGVYDLESMETTAPTGHKWKFVDFTWTGDKTDGYTRAVANYKCEHDDTHKMTVEAEIQDEVVEPTCQEEGKTVYTAAVSASDSPDETAHSESKDAEATETVPHEWKYSGMNWTGNETDGYTKAVAEYKCKYGCGRTGEVEAQLTEKETEADCENEGKTTYTATVNAEKSLTGKEHTGTKDAKITEALGHSWHLKDMIWTGDEESGFTKAQAKYVCEKDERHERFVDAKITEEVIEPTCLEEGYTVYKAVVDASESPTGAECMDVNFARIKEPTGHDWELKGFTWEATNDKRGYTAEANYVCKHDGSHEGSVGADIRIAEKTATCEEPGGKLYTAIVSKENSLTDAEAKDEKFIKEEEAAGHSFGTPKYTWSKDNSSVTAEAVCKNDSSHVKKETVKTTSKVTKEATCRDTGARTYQATFKEPLFKTQTRDVSIAKTNSHRWGEWKVTKKATTSAEGEETRTCSVCGKKETRKTDKLAPAPAKKAGGILIAKAVAQGRKAVKLKWTKVKDADGYDIFMSRCNYKGKRYTPKRIKTVKGNKTFRFTKKKLAGNTAYKAYVKAYVMKNGKKSYVMTSPVIHVFTSGYRGKSTNPKSVTVAKKSVSLKVGKTYKIKAKVNKLKSKKVLPRGHAADLRYISSDKSIVKVNASGKVTARKKGNCKVYVYAANGVWKTVKVKVK